MVQVSKGEHTSFLLNLNPSAAISKFTKCGCDLTQVIVYNGSN